jgi:hypothetical protein
MPYTQPVHLVATVHDPRNRLTALARQHLPTLLNVYRGVMLLCSHATSREAIALLRELGATAIRDEDEPEERFYFGHKRRQALRLGLTSDASHLHLCDFDRVLHWTATYADELGQTVAAIPDYDLLILGRTPRAFESHPPYQTRTETLANHAFKLAYGQEIDVTAGSRALSRRAAEYLLAHSRELGVGVDAEWPLLLQRAPGIKIGYRACEGLEFETPDRYRPEIESAGGLAAWMEAMNASPKRWAHRLRMAAEIADTAARLAGGKG